MSWIYKVLIAVGVIAAIGVGTYVYMWWNDIRFMDFFQSPVAVLDTTVYAAQQSDTDTFKRGFTKETIKTMDQVHEFNTNRPPGDFDPKIHWTWDTLMALMAQEGGFDVVEEPSFFDRWSEDTVKVKIAFENREKIYTLVRRGGVWRIDLMNSDPGFSKARNCIRDATYCR